MREREELSSLRERPCDRRKHNVYEKIGKKVRGGPEQKE